MLPLPCFIFAPPVPVGWGSRNPIFPVSLLASDFSKKKMFQGLEIEHHPINRVTVLTSKNTPLEHLEKLESLESSFCF